MNQSLSNQSLPSESQSQACTRTTTLSEQKGRNGNIKCIEKTVTAEKKVIKKNPNKKKKKKKEPVLCASKIGHYIALKYNEMKSMFYSVSLSVISQAIWHCHSVRLLIFLIVFPKKKKTIEKGI